LVCLAAALPAGADSASDLFRQARKAEQSGEFARAYLLYSQAAVKDPLNPVYWAKSQAVRTRGVLQAKAVPRAGPAVPEPPGDPADGDNLLGEISAAEIEEARRPLPPWELAGVPGLKSFDLRGDAKNLFEQVARAYGLEVVFDGEYDAGQPIRFRADEVDFPTALRALGAATNSFLIPIGPRLALVAKDTPQKRQDIEPTVVMAIPIPEPFSIQEAQELARSVQQTMEIQKFVIDSARRMVVLRDRLSKARPAQALLEQMLNRRGEVVIEVEFLDVSEDSSLEYGLRLPTSWPLVYFGGILNTKPSIPAGFAKFATFGGGKTLFGLGIADAELFARMSKSSATSLLTATMRSVDSMPVTFHVGDKYPIVTTGYFGDTGGGGEVFTPPPTINFEDLGLVVKVTPHVHGMREVTLDLEAEFKVLTGDSLNGIPVIANRKFQSSSRLRQGEWAVIAGLMSSTEIRTISGIAGLSSIPLLGPLVRQNNRTRDKGQSLLVLKPRLVNVPPSETVIEGFYVGTETRPLTFL
jgi:hypothetical protein